jgi:SAM-dependent methyltransferase
LLKSEFVLIFSGVQIKNEVVEKLMKSALKTLKQVYQKLLPANLRSGVYNALPTPWRGKMDQWSSQTNDLPISIQDLQLPTEDVGPSRFPRRVNKLCDEADWQDKTLLDLFDELGEGHIRHEKHRKAWEWAQGVYAAKQLGLLHPEAKAIGVGAGVESVLFYLTNQIKLVVATDIYGEGEFAEGEASSGMLTNPAQYARVPFRADHLQVMYMDGRHLTFPDNHFDFAFSFSSIEHFGGHQAAAESVSEMARVVKPGGAVILTTEIVLNGLPDKEFFLPTEVERYLLRDQSLQLIEDIDYSISKSTLAGYVDTHQPNYVHQLPHIVLKRGPLYYTSLAIVLQKLPG